MITLYLENALLIKICPTSTGKEPYKAYIDSAGFDLYADEIVLILPQNRSLISIGLRMQIPLGYCGKIHPRSGLTNKHGIVAFAGVIDSGFLGVVKVLLFNFSTEEYTVQKGTRIAQIIFNKSENVIFNFDTLDSKSNRNTQGFGSSGL